MKEETRKIRTYKQLKQQELLYGALLGAIIGFWAITVFLFLKGIGNAVTLIIGSALFIALFFLLLKKLNTAKEEIKIRETEEPDLISSKFKNLSIEELQKKSKSQSGIIGAFVGLITVFIVVDILSYVYTGELNFMTSTGLIFPLMFLPLLSKDLKAIKQELKRRNN